MIIDEALATVFIRIGMIGFVAVSAWLILVVGEISFGQQAFFGLGAYGAGVATALWEWPLGVGLALGAGVGGLAALILAIPTVRLRGLYFAMASLAFAEMIRLIFQMIRYRVVRGETEIGPDGTQGFGGIRYLFAHDIRTDEFLGMVWGLLAAVLCLLLIVERGRLGRVLRLVGKDPVLAASLGFDVTALRIGVVVTAGLLAGLGGGLYAHFATYVEPDLFDVMLGVHSLAYGAIGGLGTPLGPLLGVVLDIGLLESTRVFAGYRMIVFGGLVAMMLIWRPRGLLDEAVVARIAAFFRKG